MRRLLARGVRPVCFGIVSWIPQNGFVDRLDRFRRPACEYGRFGRDWGQARHSVREKNNNENNDNDPPEPAWRPALPPGPAASSAGPPAPPPSSTSSSAL